MRLPRDVSGSNLAKSLRVLGYEITRQKGSHIRVTTAEKGVYHITIQNHKPVRIGTLASILEEISEHFQISREELMLRIQI